MDANLNGLPDKAALNGLPDDATLTRLASEFFAALPGEAASLDGRPGAPASAAPPRPGASPGPQVAWSRNSRTKDPATTYRLSISI